MVRGNGTVAVRGGKGRATSNRDHAAQRLQRKRERGQGSASSGPSSILGVYDYVANVGGRDGGGADRAAQGDKKRKRARTDRAVRRMVAGSSEVNVAGPSSAPKGRKRRRQDGGHDEAGSGEEDASDNDDEDLSDTERVRVPAIFSDDEGDGDDAAGTRAFDGEDEELDSDEAFGESDEERFEGWTFAGSKSRKGDDEEESEDDQDGDEDDEDGGEMDLDKVLNAISDDDEEGSGDEDDADGADDGALGLDDFVTVPASGPEAGAGSGPADFHNFDEAPSNEGTSGQVTLEDLLAPLAQDASLGTADLRKRVSALASENLTRRRSGAKEGTAAIDTRTGALAAPLPAILQDRVDRAAAYEATRAQVEGWQPTLKRLREAEHLSFPLQKAPVNESSNASLVASMMSTKRGAPTQSSLEAQTADLLRAAEMTDSQITKREDLAMNKLDPALVEERRKELARMRELMFRAEQKAKRVSKIKSKSYRRIARKEKEKLKQKMAEAGLSLDDDEDEIDYEAEQAERLKAERERAMERATLKHKSTGQWAKTMSSRRGKHEETLKALNEQFQRGEQLRKRIQGEASDDEDDDGSDVYRSDNDADKDEGDETGLGRIRSEAFDELATLEAKEAARALADEDAIEAAASGEGGGLGKGMAKVMQMKFMRDARARADQGVRDAAEELRADLLRAEQKAENGEDLDEEGRGEASLLKGRVEHVGGDSGRAVFAAGKDATRPSLATTQKGKDRSEASDAGADSLVGSLSTNGIVGSTTSKPSSRQARSVEQVADLSNRPAKAGAVGNDGDDGTAPNPWLQPSGSTSIAKISKKRNEVVVGRNSDAIAKAANRVERHASKASSARLAAAEDARVEIEDAEAGLVDSSAQDGPSTATHSAQTASKPQPKAKAATSPAVEASDDDDDDEDRDGIVAVPRGRGGPTKKGLTFSQLDLVAEAFAGDDVAAQFAEEKRALVEADAPQVEDNSLPGWGTWGGKGVKHSAAQRARIEANRAKHLKVTPGLDPSKRKDAGMEHVILNERVDKKLEKYKVKDLPHPFTSAAQYDMVMRNSLGAEWNTRTQHQRMTLPRVVTKPGKAIQPIERKF